MCISVCVKQSMLTRFGFTPRETCKHVFYNNNMSLCLLISIAISLEKISLFITYFLRITLMTFTQDVFIILNPAFVIQMVIVTIVHIIKLHVC
jgi:hypothetical protein